MTPPSFLKREPRIGNAVWLAGALSCGAFLGGMDSRPGWDDTGVTVGLVLICSAVFGAFRPRWAWASALAVGVWIPIVEIPATGNAGALAAVAVAFAGTCLGVLLRRMSSQRPAPWD